MILRLSDRDSIKLTSVCAVARQALRADWLDFFPFQAGLSDYRRFRTVGDYHATEGQRVSHSGSFQLVIPQHTAADNPESALCTARLFPCDTLLVTASQQKLFNSETVSSIVHQC